MRKIQAVLAIVMLAGACGDEAGPAPDTETTVEATVTSNDPRGSTSRPPASTTAAPPSTAASTTSTTAASSTTTTTTSTTALAPVAGTLALTRVVFEPSAYVVVTNVGGQSAELGAHWLCVFPSYQQLPAHTVEPGQSVAIGLDTAPPPDLIGFAEVFDLGPVVGTPQAADGEMALYTAADFGSATAIADYVQWGSGDHQRSSVAAEAGIWTPGAFVEVPPEALGISSSGAIGGNESDWFAEVGG